MFKIRIELLMPYPTERRKHRIQRARTSTMFLRNYYDLSPHLSRHVNISKYVLSNVGY